MQKYYAKIENEQTKTVSIGTGTNHAFYESIGMVEMDVEQSDIDGQWYVKGHAPMKSEAQKQEEAIKAAYDAFDANVEARLNTFAATRRYSSINSACSYSTSTDPTFRAEGEYCVQARDATYRKCYDLLAEYMPDVLAGKRPIPTWEEIEAQLPPLVWPDEQVVEEPALDSTTA
jgi:hypothetical protein